MMATQHLPQVGARISYSGHLGTVRFVGQVHNTSGTWLGVEWDDPQRGKHDGLKDGIRYFTCLAPNAASFIRPSAAVSLGRSFLAAVISKYVELLHGPALEKVVLGSSRGTIEVEAVGLDRIRGNLSQLERLREVSLDGENVSTADPSGAVANTCPGIRGLDLSKSLIPTWDIVALIVSELPQLQRLALNQNRLRPPANRDIIAPAFRGVRELQLNSTLTTWVEMQVVIGDMPALRSVEMGYNRLHQLSSHPSDPRPERENAILCEMNLDSNNLSSWLDTCRALRSFTALQRLVLTSNSIETIDDIFDPAPSPVARLKHLSLSFNRIADWRDIDRLPLWCPELESLTLAGNPLVEDPVRGKNARQFIIAKIPSLAILHAAVISSKERDDSELFYLSHVNRNGPPSEEAKCLEHPRWRALCEKHGRPDSVPSAAQDQHDTLKKRLIEIHVYRCSEIPSHNAQSTTGPPTLVRVLPNMPVRNFALKVGKSLKIAKAKTSMRIWLKMPDDKVVEVETDDSHSLEWWGIDDRSEVFVVADKIS